jgi:DNA polymerase I-like protein with 3'-5' exonuclease and polymerase domains
VHYKKKEVKMIKAPDGWLFAAVDGSQAESRCTAYISGDVQLIYNVENSPDFHCTNCSLFFGIPFEELYDVANSKVLRKDIRNVGKRVNHGANYNMGAYVLWETMGDKEVFNAARLLDLPRNYTALQITATLLRCFNNTYPTIKGEWYGKVVDEVRNTGRLVGATGWTRRTFLEPHKSKLDLNACVAHPPQSLSVMGVNKAFVEVWKRQISDLNGRIRLRMQVHDELVVCHKPDDLEPVHMLAEIFMRNNTVTIRGKTMVIPCEPKHSAATWGELKE